MAKRKPSPKSKRAVRKAGKSVRPEPKAKTLPANEDLLRRTKAELLEHARSVGLTGVQRLTKTALAAQIQRAARKETEPPNEPEEQPADAPHKLDLGLAATPGNVREPQEDIPWGYGVDRVTAMSVDPERLYIYWEVTDQAIARARVGLGPAGRDAWLNLRVYDVTDRIFDGTIAHAYFDHSISRTDRQWFFFLGRPTSTVVVEIGLNAAEGYFVRIVRSGRVDFPRRESVSRGGVEWLTVRSASGEVGTPRFEPRDVPVVVGSVLPNGHREPVRA